MKQEQYDFYSNFAQRQDLDQYAQNGLLLYCLQIKYAIEDIDEVASTCLVDGPDDKKADLVYFDSDSGEAVIAQGYFSTTDKNEAPASKASNLNTAVSWLLTVRIEDVPERLKSVAQELRQRINDGEVKRITLWYSHNLPESQNVKNELATAENTLNSILRTHFSTSNIEACSIEVGLETINDWYQGLTIPILVTQTITLAGCEGFRQNGRDWISFTTAIPAKILYDLYRAHGTHLFSANVRDYLGSRRSDANINNGIKQTAQDDPGNFFVFNNGISALVNSFEYNDQQRELTINGLSIVNGAQTTGSIGSLSNQPDQDLVIPIRLIKCGNPDTVASIVKFNNSQNKINAPDFRSNDHYQKRITGEFSQLGNIEYSPRRGGSADIIRRNPRLLPSITAGQVLAAFHGEPSIAYNLKSKIWDQDSLYSRFFNEQTTAKHIFFCFALLKAIEQLKIRLTAQEESLIEPKKKALDFLRSRGSIVLFHTAISDVLEIILNRPISNKFAVQFRNNLSLENAISLWTEILDITSSFVDSLKRGLQDGIRNKERIDQARSEFKQLVNAIRTANASTFDHFAGSVVS